MNVAIIDDEPLARARIKRLLEKHKDMKLVANASNGKEGLKVISTLHPDLIFLDIGMPDMDGFQLLQSSSNGQAPYVIFSTAYPEHAVKAFEFNAVDYLLKPYNKQRFDSSLDKARQHFNYLKKQQSTTTEPSQYLSELVICDRGREDHINLENVSCIQAFGNYLRLLVEDKAFLYRMTMSEMESKLDPAIFMRVHRSYIVNKNFISNINYLSKNEYAIKINDHLDITSGRKYMPEIKQYLSRSF